MEKPQQFDLFKEPPKAADDVPDEELPENTEQQGADKAAIWEAEKEEFGTKTDQEKREEKKRLEGFIATEKERIFGKDEKKKDDELL